jgi:signal transduction histidine kinase/CheY-like chemotaxis protein
MNSNKNHFKDVFPFLTVGTENIEDLKTKRSIVVINTLALVTAVMVISVGFLLFMLTKSLLIIIPAFIECGCFIGVILLNRAKKYFLANVTTLTIHTLFAIYFGAVLGDAMPIELITAFLFTFLIGTSFLVYDNNVIKAISIAATGLIFLAVQGNNHFRWIDPIYLMPTEQSNVRMWCWVGMLVLMSVVTYYIIRQNNRYVRENTQLQALKIATASQSAFLRETSHELRTPLNAVFGIAQLLYSSKGITDMETRKDIEYLYAASNLARDIINNVLDFAKIEAGKLDEIKKESFNLRDWMESCITMNRYIAVDKGMRIDIEYDPALPEWVISDKLFLTKIINNLTSNAIKFSAQASVITIKIYKREQQLFFDVKNPGVIPPEKIKTIFDPFVSERNNLFAGTGLGLQITKNLVEALGGSIAVVSDNKDTLFTFNTPLSIGKDSRKISPLVPDKALEGWEILIIEDNLLNSHILTKFIGKMGAKAIHADNGKDGLALLKSQRPQLVILDNKLPDMSGLAILKGLRADEEYKQLPIIICSADAFGRDEMLDAGADDFVTKPISFTALYDTICKILPARIVSAI